MGYRDRLNVEHSHLINHSGTELVHMWDMGEDVLKAEPATPELKSIYPLIRNCENPTGLLPVLDVWHEEESHTLFVTVPKVDGVLTQYREKPTEIQKGDLLSGLETIHNMGFAHGDIRPQNIFVSTSAIGTSLMLGDFDKSYYVDPRARESIFAQEQKALLGLLE